MEDNYDEIDAYFESQEFKDKETEYWFDMMKDQSEYSFAKKKKSSSTIGTDLINQLTNQPAPKPEKRVRTFKVWEAKMSDVTCDFCKKLNGQKVRYQNMFTAVGSNGKEYKLSGPPSHKFCQCTMKKIQE